MKLKFIILLAGLFIFINLQINAQWTQTNGVPGGTITNLAANQNLIFAGSQGAGGFISTNNGERWNAARNGIYQNVIASIIVGNRIIAGTRYGIFISDDLGQNWVQTLQGNGYWHVTNFTNIPQTIFAGLDISGHTYVYYSTNNGENWLSTGFQALGWNITGIECSDTHIYVSTQSDSVYVSPIGNFSWTGIFRDGSDALLLIEPYLYIKRYDALWTYNIETGDFNSISIGLNNIDVTEFLYYSNKIYATAFEGLYTSTNLGATWTFNANIGEQTVYTIIEKNDTLFIGLQYNGVYRSSDNGQSWDEVNRGITNSTIYDFIAYDDAIYCADVRGVWRTTDGGSDWEKINFDSSSNLIRIYSDTMYVSTFYPKFYKRNIGDSIWSNINLPNIGYWPINDFVVVNSNYYLASDQNGLFKSNDGGNTWASIGNGLPLSIYALLFKNNIFFAGTKNGLYRSDDEGENWNYLTGGSADIVTISVNGEYICAGASDLSGIFYSTDGGNTWIQNLYYNYFYSVIAAGEYFLAGTDLGFIFSSDRGENWYIDNIGYYQNPWTTKILLHDNYIFSSIVDQGLWKRPADDFNSLFITPIGQQTDQFYLKQNYPNPFNPITVISYQLPVTGNVTLKVYDVLGNEVVTLVNEEKQAGVYEVEFDGSALTSGIYFYQIKTGQFSETKKMILLK